VRADYCVHVLTCVTVAVERLSGNWKVAGSIAGFEVSLSKTPITPTAPDELAVAFARLTPLWVYECVCEGWR